MTMKMEAEAVMMPASYLKESFILEIFRDTESTKRAEIDAGYQAVCLAAIRPIKLMHCT